MTLADVCRGRAGVPMNEWCVHDVREVHPACVVDQRADLALGRGSLELWEGPASGPSGLWRATRKFGNFCHSD